MFFATHASRARIRAPFEDSSARRLALFLGLASIAALALLAVTTPRARADFGFRSLGLSFSDEGGAGATRAGSHPFAWTTALDLNTSLVSGEEVPDEDLKDLRIQLPPGLVGTPALLPRCSNVDFLTSGCPAGTAVGTIELHTSLLETAGETFPLYNLIPAAGSVAELGFHAAETPVTIEVALNREPPYNLVASLTNVSQAAAFFGSVLTVRGSSGEAPLLTLPRSCPGPVTAGFEADSWQRPGEWVSPGPGAAPDPLVISGCAELGFAPTVSAGLTTTVPQSASGFDLSLDLDDQGLVSPTGRAESDLRKLELTLPEGVTVNPAIATGLGACTREDLARETLAAAPGDGCPEASRVGTALVRTPLFDQPLKGTVFVAQPDDAATGRPGAENPFDSLLALYVVIENPALGVIVKQAAEVEADPRTGRLTVLVDDLPQLPFSHFELHFREGPRSPLSSPASCGSYAVASRLTPWSGTSTIDSADEFKIDRGCAVEPFAPRLSAGATNPVAGASSPFVLSLTREDGEQNISGFQATLPAGLTARLGTVPLCPDDLAADGRCPSSARIGSIEIAAGVGATPLSIPPVGQAGSPVYLAGPYEGAPFSLVVAVPAQAGPFDLGTVVARAAIEIDPRVAQGTVVLQALPQILRGIPLAYRTLRIEIDRPGFTRNPTSCEPARVQSSIASAQGASTNPSVHFRVGGCASLGFRPRISMTLLGPTHRGAHPAVRVGLVARKGDADLRRVAVTLPATELLDDRRIRAVCTRDRYALGRCPSGALVGHAKVWTPVLGRPLEGPVYLRASDHGLPNVVASLGDQVHLDLVGRVDSIRGHLRVTFPAIPDAPLSRFALTLLGGRRGLLSNTGGICAAGRLRSEVSMDAQNGKAYDSAPAWRTDCAKKGR